MFRVAVQMFMYEKTKYLGVIVGVGFTAFLVAFALSYFAGFMTRGFALVAENPSANVWVMDKAVNSTEATVNMSDSSLGLVRGVKGVNYASPLYLGQATARFANGHFQDFQLIGVDDTTLSGAALPTNGLAVNALRLPNSVVVDSGGTNNKLQTPLNKEDQWPYDGSHLNVATRLLRYGDELLLNDSRVVIAGVSNTIARFPPRPLMYTTFTNFKRINPSQGKNITFIMVNSQKDISAKVLAQNISQQTGLKAITSDAFKAQTVQWFMINSEDVGDMVNMIVLAMLVGFGVTGVMLYMLTFENLKQYAVLKAMGALNKQLINMIFTQAFVATIIGSGIGIGLCAIIGHSIASTDFPFRMMWFSPLFGFLAVYIVSITAALISIKPIINMQPGIVFSR